MKYKEVLDQFSSSLDEVIMNARLLISSRFLNEIETLFRLEYQEIDNKDKVRLLEEKASIYGNIINTIKGFLCLN